MVGDKDHLGMVNSIFCLHLVNFLLIGYLSTNTKTLVEKWKCGLTKWKLYGKYYGNLMRC